ncbi:MAG: FHA domain-containing protein [Myxococcales bacterium]|nr:FHA domain-containing protein [Myxococcales bacterium]
MWKLTIEDDEQKQVSLQLAHEEYSVGRDEANAIRLTDRNISRKHAVLVRNGQGWLVKDLASYNGTFVNGERVADVHHVGHGDVVQLGDYRLEIQDDARSAVPTAQQQVQLPPHHRPDRLVVVVGPQPGQEFFLDKDHFTMGRSEDADVSVNHSSVSRFHAELFAVGNGRYEIIDKGSANGIRINGQEVRRGFIEAGDALELGDVRLRFVGAGKIFRAGFDTRQMLPAVTGLDPALMAPARKPSSSSSILRMVGVGALLGVVGVGAAAAYVATKNNGGKTEPTASASEAVKEDPGKPQLEQAKKLAEGGDLEGAHKAIAAIDATSPSLKDPAVQEIEGKWADSVIAESEKHTDDPAKQVDLLWKVATTPTVDDARRKKAAEMIKSIDPTIEVPTNTRPGTAPLPAPVPTFKPKPSATASSGKGPDGTDRKALDDPKGKIADLMSRLDSLNERELGQLVGLCVQENNAACRNKAAKRLQELQSGKSP